MDVFGGNVKGTRPQVQIVPPQNPWKIPWNPLFWKYLEIIKPTPVRHHESEILSAYVGMPSCRLNSVLFVQGPKTSDVLSTGILPGSIRCLKNIQKLAEQHVFLVVHRDAMIVIYAHLTHLQSGRRQKDYMLMMHRNSVVGGTANGAWVVDIRILICIRLKKTYLSR